ncbi:MAG: hypothetical protein KatS3mg051_2144 [Anaerolineae bacterium]|nr:MAG: hypothetical protein KatS3mg051_1815 [Anaerolineae bacterium]GIV82790.1 MAG: hypothetical protein KatS3mg051_2144 [Anaerolineae bacterium]
MPRIPDTPAVITIGGRRFRVAETALRGDEQPSFASQEAPNQPSERVENEAEISNLGLGWGFTLAPGPGRYALGDTAILHRYGLFAPGMVFTELALPFTPVAYCRPSFTEYNTRIAADRRLLVVTARHILEIDTLGNLSAVDMGASFDLTRGMSKAVAFSNIATGGVYVYVARPSVNPADPMVERTPSGTWQVSPNGKYAEALGAGKDAVGMDVLWRIDQNGRLNSAVADGHPSVPGSWQAETASTPVSPAFAFTNDVFQSGRYVIVARSDGFYTFDSLANAVPITRGHEQSQYRYAGMWMRDLNGSVVAPSGFGLIQLYGNEWSVIGPVSANRTQRELVGRETAVTAMVGASIYCAVYDPVSDVSRIFYGTPKVEGDETPSPLTWHGPVGLLPGEVCDLTLSTVTGKRLWAATTGATPRVWYADLNEMYEPQPSATSGYIYLPENALDFGGPGVKKNLRKVEYVYSPAAPYHADENAWELQVWDGTGWVGPDTETGANFVRHGWFEQEVEFYRLWARLRYQTTAPARCGLERVYVRAIERPERSRIYRVTVELGWTATSRTFEQRTRKDDISFLRRLVRSGRAVTVSFDDSAPWQAVLISLETKAVPRGDNYAAEYATFQLYEVAVDAERF